MRRPPFRISTMVAITGVLATLACQRDDSILLVEVAGDLTIMPAQLSVTVSADSRSRMLLVPPDFTAISLPTSFTVELDRSITGPVTIAIDAIADNGTILASGTTTQTHIIPGGQTIITVTLVQQ